MKSVYERGTLGILLMLVMTALLGCGEDSAPPVLLTTVTPQPFSTKQSLWINPNPYCKAGFKCSGATMDYSQDYYDLFLKPETWKPLQERVDVFQFFINYIPEHYVLTRAKTLFLDKKIDVAVEGGGLLPNAGCDDPATHDQVGEKSFAIEEAKIQALANAGITLNYFTMDEPIARVLAGGQPNNCQFTLDQAADELADYVELMTKNHPKMQMGWIVNLPNWKYNQFPAYGGTGKGWGYDLNFAEVVNAVTQKLAERSLFLGYFRINNPYNYIAGTQTHKIAALAQQIKTQTSMRLGLIYNSDVPALSLAGGADPNATYVAESLISNYELTAALRAIYGLNVDDHVYESWYNYPERLFQPAGGSVTPADEYTFMHMVSISLLSGLTP